MARIDLKDLLNLVDLVCTKDQVKELLQGLDNPDVRVSAPTKGRLIHNHLRHAVEISALSETKLLDFFRDAEENQNQHIFFYRVPDGSPIEPPSIDEVGAQLFGPKWTDEQDFPQFNSAEGKFKYVDLRIPDAQRKPHDWLLKIYGQQLVLRSIGKETRGNQILKVSEWVSERQVILVRWNAPNLLEIRVPQGESYKQVRFWLDRAWEMIARVFQPGQFEKWNLHKIMNTLVQMSEEHKSLYRCSHTKLRDDDDTIVSYSARQPNVNVLKAHVVASMHNFRERQGDTTYMRLTWLKQNEGFPSRDIVVLLGTHEQHEIVVGSHQTAKEIDYGTSQLRHFGRQQSGVEASNPEIVSMDSAPLRLGHS